MRLRKEEALHCFFLILCVLCDKHVSGKCSPLCILTQSLRMLHFVVVVVLYALPYDVAWASAHHSDNECTY